MLKLDQLRNSSNVPLSHLGTVNLGIQEDRQRRANAKPGPQADSSIIDFEKGNKPNLLTGETISLETEKLWDAFTVTAADRGRQKKVRYAEMYGMSITNCGKLTEEQKQEKVKKSFKEICEENGWNLGWHHPKLDMIAYLTEKDIGKIYESNYSDTFYCLTSLEKSISVCHPWALYIDPKEDLIYCGSIGMHYYREALKQNDSATIQWWEDTFKNRRKDAITGFHSKNSWTNEQYYLKG